jgi:hypothetical protein
MKIGHLGDVDALRDKRSQRIRACVKSDRIDLNALGVLRGE